MKLSEIHTQFNTDKGTVHSYIDVYDQLFEKFQHGAINFLEIGALTCGSLKMWHTYFSQAQVYGVDNWSQQADHEGVSFASKGINLVEIVQDVARNYPRVHLITCDSTNAHQVTQKFHNMQFSIIVDDGDHDPHAQMRTFVNFYPYWDSSQGIYVIEDVMDVNYLNQLLVNHVTQNKWPVNMLTREFRKNHRGDDNLILITSCAG